MAAVNHQNDAKLNLVHSLLGRGAHLSFDDAVRDFPESMMNGKPPYVPYSFYHMLEHIKITQWDILMYIQDPDHVSPDWPSGYWPSQHARADRRAWDLSIGSYRADLQKLVGLVSNPSCDLFAPVPHMEGRSVLREALLVIDHTSYHLGEFVMGRQILGAWKSELG